MNKGRRKELKKAIDLLYEAIQIIEEVRDEEQEAYDNIPESLQDSERAETMQEYIDSMDEAYNEIEDHITTLEEIIE